MRNVRRRPLNPSDFPTFGSDLESRRVQCLSCTDRYFAKDAGTCRDCYDEASETEQELKREINDLKAKLGFLQVWSSSDSSSSSTHLYPERSSFCFTDVVLVAASEVYPIPIYAHKAVLVSRSPVFRAMLKNEMAESLSGTIKISDVSHNVLEVFVNYLYTANAELDEQMACDLLIMAEKYEVKHMKDSCENFILSRLNWDNSLSSLVFAHQHNAKGLFDAALLVIVDNIDKLNKKDEYMELVEKEPMLVVEIFEAYLSNQKNTAQSKSGLQLIMTNLIFV
ncbi:BTB/POZ domain-containing protein At4g08455 isoform X2 [Impatiens glandulifera]|uniref:BTB/POZ domain-containing protein At4g08455 isoform X2 n=1 Tax=Impatiens glandulifera TaxID=253017 RepID=UPI001FB0CBBA|nr:BTB/POZ domain-containing protein At4g08455 isoform X2 [Impatiens glandulifera]